MMMRLCQAEEKQRQDEQAARVQAATQEAQKKLRELQRRMLEGEAISPEELAAAAAAAAGDLPGHGKAEGAEAQKVVRGSYVRMLCMLCGLSRDVEAYACSMFIYLDEGSANAYSV